MFLPFQPQGGRQMKSVFSKLIIAGLLLFILFVSPASASDQSRGFKIGKIKDLNHQSGKLGTFKALVIGINDYKDPEITDLKTAVNDAKEMGNLLQTKYGFSIDLLLDHQATKAAIVKKLRKLATSANPNESILIYYAGHGDLDRVLNDGWWIPWDAKGGEPTTYLDNTLVQKVLNAIKARHVLLVSDSCYSGTLFGQSRALPQVIDDRYYLSLYNEKSRWGMTSGNKTPVSDAGSEGHSVFAYQLLKALRKNEKPYVTTQEVFTQIASIIANNSDQTPLCQPIRNAGDQGGGFVFVAALKKEPQAVTPPAPPTVPKPLNAGIDTEMLFWQSIQHSDDPDEYKAYLEEFPNGKFAGLAKIKIRKLTPQKVVAPIISADDLGRGVLNALKKKDVEQFLRFFPTKDDWQGIVSLIPPDMSPEEKENVKKRIKNIIARWDDSIKRFRGSFYEIYERGIKEGVDWETATYDSVEYKPRVEMVEISDIDLLFSSSNIKYSIKLDDCLNFKRGWLIMDRLYWKGVDLPKAAAKPKLFVATDPKDARVRILNIKPRFHQGIELDPGDYHIEVSADRYETKKQWVALSTGKDKTLEIRLKAVGAPSPVQGAFTPGQTWREPVTGMEFVRMAGGCFQMGSPASEPGRGLDEGPVHEVCVQGFDGFWMGKYEVTNAQYRRFKSGHNSKDYKGNSLNGNNQPAVHVSWDDAKAFVGWLNRQNNGRYKFKLPTEAEWEYAARAGTNTVRYWGDDSDETCQYANVHDQTSKRNIEFDWEPHNCDDGYAVTAPVGRFKPNGFGLYDMLGNVWEWCEDIYDKNAYGKHNRNDPVVTSGGSSRVGRGGSWGSRPGYVRSADRRWNNPAGRNGILGFRLFRRTGNVN